MTPVVTYIIYYNVSTKKTGQIARRFVDQFPPHLTSTKLLRSLVRKHLFRELRYLLVEIWHQTTDVSSAYLESAIDQLVVYTEHRQRHWN